VTAAAPRLLPRLPRQVVSLERVRDSLDRWAALTAVRGIQGYGKTTAVAAWLREQPASVRSVWVSLGAKGGAETFGKRLTQELHGSGQTHPARGGPQGPLGLLNRVARDLADGERLVLVIDDAHRLSEVSILTSLVDMVAHHRRLHLIFCSRGQHPIENYARGVVETAIVPARELLLTVTEIGELANITGVPLSLAEAQRLHDAFGGWIAAIGLVLDEVRDGSGELAMSSAEEYLRDTALSVIVDQQLPHQVIRFCLAERLTHRLIRDFADEHDPDALLGLMESSGLAERHYDGDEVVLEFPTFIRTVLREVLTAREPVAARTMHRRLSKWFMDHDGPAHPVHAMHHAIAGEDWHQLDRLWTHHSAALGWEYPQALENLLDRVPEPILAERPGMQVGRAFAQVAATALDSDDGPTATVNTYLQVSRRVAAQGLDTMPLHDLLYVGTGYMISLRVEGRYEDTERLGAQLEQRAAALIAAGADPGDRLSWFYLQRGLTQTLRARHLAAAQCYRLSWQHRGRTGATIAAHTAANLALTHALAAAPRTSQRWLGRYAAIDTSRRWASNLAGVGAHLAASVLALDSLDRETCLAELSRIGDGAQPSELWPYAAYLRAEYGLQFGDPLTTLRTLEDAEAAQPPGLLHGEAATILLARARADLLTALGQGQRAGAALASHVPNATLSVAAARLQLLAADPAAARQTAAESLWHQSADNRARMELLLVAAAAAHRMNDHAASADLIAQAVALYRHTGLLRAFAMVPADELATLLDDAGQRLSPVELAKLHAHPLPFPRSVPLIRLTPREQVLADALAHTGSRQDIAEDLYVSVNTVRAQLTTLYRKLGVHTREEALARLAELGLRTRTDSTSKEV
jgi:LuxR family maltose regulon positive regulatory protein